MKRDLVLIGIEGCPYGKRAEEALKKVTANFSLDNFYFKII